MNEEANGLVLMVAIHTGVHYDDIMSPNKSRAVVRARDIATLLVRRRLGLTYPALAAVFGRSPDSIKNSSHRAMKSNDAQATIREILEKL